MDIAAKKKYFKTVADIAHYMAKDANNHGLEITMRPDVKPNLKPIIPYDGSLLLEMDKIPYCFHTPLGSLRPFGSVTGARSTEFSNAMQQKFALVEVGINEDSGAIIYAVTKDAEGKDLPMPLIPLYNHKIDAKSAIWDWERIHSQFGEIGDPQSPATIHSKRIVEQAINQAKKTSRG